MKQTKKLYDTLISEYKKRIDEMKVKLAFKDISKEDRAELEIELSETTEKLNASKSLCKHLIIRNNRKIKCLQRLLER